MVYFFDLGICSYDIDNFQFKNTIYGYGLGLKVFVSGIGAISLDIGFNPYGRWEFHPSDNSN